MTIETKFTENSPRQVNLRIRILEVLAKIEHNSILVYEHTQESSPP